MKYTSALQQPWKTCSFLWPLYLRGCTVCTVDAAGASQGKYEYCEKVCFFSIMSFKNQNLHLFYIQSPNISIILFYIFLKIEHMKTFNGIQKGIVHLCPEYFGNFCTSYWISAAWNGGNQSICGFIECHYLCHAIFCTTVKSAVTPIVVITVLLKSVPVNYLEFYFLIHGVSYFEILHFCFS